MTGAQTEVFGRDELTNRLWAPECQAGNDANRVLYLHRQHHADIHCKVTGQQLNYSLLSVTARLNAVAWFCLAL